MDEDTEARELLETLILYIRFQNVRTVARLMICSPGTVRNRLEGLSVKTRPGGDRSTDVVALNGISSLAGKICELQAGGLDLDELAKEPWTLEEDELLVTISDDDLLAVVLGRPVQAVKFRRQGGGQGPNHRRWTVEENAFLLRSPLTIAEIAAELGRTAASVQKQRDRLRRRQAQG